MRFHRRGALPDRVTAALTQWQHELDAALAAESALPVAMRRTTAAITDQHWTAHRQSNALKAVVAMLEAMASPDLARCMYCEHDRGSEIDHAQPRSRAPSRTFEWQNHVWACGTCNRQKLESYDADRVIPTVDDPLRHLDLTNEGRWNAREDSPRGAATLKALPLLNHQRLVEARSKCRRRLRRKLEALAAAEAPSPQEIEELREMATTDPFSDVFAAMLSVFALPNADAYYPPAVLRFIEMHPEVHRWLPEADAQRLVDAAPKVALLASAMRPRTKPHPTD